MNKISSKIHFFIYKNYIQNFKEDKMKKVFIKIGICIFITLIILFLVTGISCAITPEGITIITGDYESPKYIELKVQSANSINLNFSKAIKLEKIIIKDNSTKESIINNIENPNSDIINVTFENKLACDKQYIIEGYIKDVAGNTLYFTDLFSGYNDRIPKVRLNEIRTEYSNPKCEFIELLICSDGNLGGMEIISAYDGLDKTYIFPSVEVRNGEYVVLHCRKLDENSVDEIGDDCLLSVGSETGDYRDLWIDNNSARLGKSDVILLKDKKDGNILDAVLYSQTDNTEWKTDILVECATQAFESNNWEEGSLAENAVCSDGITTTRSLSRVNDGHNKNSWIVTATSNATIGKPNSTTIYVKK